MNKITQRTEHDRKTGDPRSAGINGSVERIKAAKVEKKGTCRSGGKVGGFFQSAMVGGREEEREASRAEWC